MAGLQARALGHIGGTYVHTHSRIKLAYALAFHVHPYDVCVCVCACSCPCACVCMCVCVLPDGGHCAKALFWLEHLRLHLAARIGCSKSRVPFPLNI